MSISIRLLDGSIRELPDGVTGLDLAKTIGPRLAESALAVRINGVLRDLMTPLSDMSEVAVVTERDTDALDLIRHSAAHLLAQAVQRLFPGTLVGVGPTIEDGFYYDFKVEKFFTPEDLVTIELEMRKISEENIPIICENVQRDDAMSKFKMAGEVMKMELVSAIPAGETILGYRQGEFYDLCRGPHVPNTSKIKVFKLLHTAAAYWRGDEKNAQLCRVYGTAFLHANDLQDYIQRLEEAKLRDHRKLGKQLDLFSFQSEAPASPFFHPKGTVVYNELVNYMRSCYFRSGYDEVITPMALDVSLWKLSGHYDHYSENMYFTNVDEREYALKPMNCPSHCLIYRNNLHSYRDLPIRYADFGRLHRYERSGVTHGLTRVRTFCQDDAHIFCTPEQTRTEMASFLEFLKTVYHTFGFNDMRVNLSTRPAKRLGGDDIWNHTETALADALKEANMDYQVNPGDGAFYGPKIDFEVMDALKRPWQLGTLQVDYAMPANFGLTYVKPDGTDGTPVMLHRALLGSLERFIGILIEHCAGAFPVWLSPVQVAILPITERVHEYALAIRDKALDLGVRVHVDLRNEKVNAKIRDAQLSKIPYMLILGDREMSAGNVSVRHRSKGDMGSLSLDSFLTNLTEEIRMRTR
jgi:threonyl-tRNA synthetase